MSLLVIGVLSLLDVLKREAYMRNSSSLLTLSHIVITVLERLTSESGIMSRLLDIRQLHLHSPIIIEIYSHAYRSDVTGRQTASFRTL